MAARAAQYDRYIARFGAVFLYRIAVRPNNMWGRYQRWVTGKDYEEAWRLSDGRIVKVDAINGKIVEVKWTNAPSSAYSSSPYNPSHEFYNEEDLVDQLAREMQLAREQGLPGVVVAVSNEAAQADFMNLIETHFPEEYQSGFIKVWMVPVTGIPPVSAEPER